MKPSDEKEMRIFFKYTLFVPAILTLILEWLQFTNTINVSWFWVLSPIWIWVGGMLQFLIGGIITSLFEDK